MTYEEFITKHNLHLDLTWKGFEVRPPATRDDKPWPGFKWEYRVGYDYPGIETSPRVALIGDYTQGIGHGKWHGLLAYESHNRGGIAYDPKVGRRLSSYAQTS